MKIKTNSLLLLLIILGACTSNVSEKTETDATDPLLSWNDNDTMKQKIIKFVENEVPKISVGDRIAVFDMDGTVICEKPLGLEMFCSVEGLCYQLAEDPSLIDSSVIYEYAKQLHVNPDDTALINSDGYQDHYHDMVYKAFPGWPSKTYIDTCSAILNKKVQPKDSTKLLINTFYQPMIELIAYLKANSFEIYIVSGSLQGLVWTACEQGLKFDRRHLIGTRQQMKPVYYPDERTDFILDSCIWVPENNDDGKALNIYSYIGKTPVFAFGNTTGDFGMFRLTSTNTLPHVCFMLNHDDSIREYAYPPYYSNPDGKWDHWEDTVKSNGWNIVNMKESFEVVWED